MGNLARRLAPLALLAFAVLPARAQKAYDPGASDTQIKIGNFMHYRGPFAEFGAIGRAEAAYFRMINDQGGVNGRQITFISLDASEGGGTALGLARKLVEQEQVLFFAGTWGAMTNRAIRPYLNEHHIPQLFVSANDRTFEDPQHYPWTMGFSPSKHTEAEAYARYVLKFKPDARIAVLYSSDEEGLEYRDGLRDGLGPKAGAMIVKETAFRYTEREGLATLIKAFQKTGADVFMNFAVGKFASEGIKVAYELGWHPLQFIPNGSLSIEANMDQADLAEATGVICNARSKGWVTPMERSEPAVRAFLAWLHQYNPTASERDAHNVYGYLVAQTVVAVLKQCGDDLTRANVMKQAEHLDLAPGILRPGIHIRTSPTDYRPIKDLYYVRYNGQRWTAVTGELEH